MTQNNRFQAIAEALMQATNAFDADAVLALFTPDAVIDDPSTGEVFEGHEGIRDYVDRFFVGYNTVSVLLSLTLLGADSARARVDFTGDFGHEIGRLDLVVNGNGLIRRIDADLE